MADYSQAIRLDPNYALAYFNRGYTYYYKGDYDRAIADYNQVIRLDPNLANDAKEWLERAKRRGR
jgi:tetratricopeptide (TPR) repeat protein